MNEDNLRFVAEEGVHSPVNYDDTNNDDQDQYENVSRQKGGRHEQRNVFDVKDTNTRDDYEVSRTQKSSVIQRHLTFDNEIEEGVELDEDEDEEEEKRSQPEYHQYHRQYHHQYEEEEEEEELEEEEGDNRKQRDVENPPLHEDDNISRKFDTSLSQSRKRNKSSDSLDDLGSSSLSVKNRKGKEHGGGSEEAGVMSKLNVVWLPTKAWLGEVWRDLTCVNASHCVREAKAACQTLFVAEDTWSMCLQYLLVGLVMSFVCEVVSEGAQYNTALLLALIAGFEFRFFPTNSVRPQLVLSVLVGISFMLDIMLFAQPSHLVNDAAKVLTAFVFLAKGLALYNFLCLSNTGSRAKKYLWRRIRVFFVPLSYPRKPMREIRSRILAIEWLQGGVAIGYIVLFVFGFMTIGVANVMSSPSAGLALVAFLPIKFLTSSGILMVLLIDTDITLCLAYFGCLGGVMSYVKAYIHSKYQEYGGWPLSYALNPYRVYAIVFVKFIDVCFGFAGWAAVGTTFSEYYSLGYNVMALVAGTVTLLVLSDLWIPVLFFFVVRLIQRHEALVRHLQEHEEDSDDSELDEFDIRNNETAIKNGREMRYRNLNQGFLKPFKSKYSVGSSSSDEGLSSSSSDNDDEDAYSSRSQKKRKNKKKNNIRSEAESDGSKASGSLHLDINLDLALGGNDEDDNENDDDGNDEMEEKEVEPEKGYDESNRLTSPGPLRPQHLRREGGHESPSLLPAAHGWGRHNKVAASSSPFSSATQFSPGKGSWGQATSDATTWQSKPSRRQVGFEDDTLPDTTQRESNPPNLPPKSPFSTKLPPLVLDTSSSPAPVLRKGQGRPPSVPKLQLSSLTPPRPGTSSSPASHPHPHTLSPAQKVQKNDNDDLDSDVEYTFDSPFQPSIRTKTGTPLQHQSQKTIPHPPSQSPQPSVQSPAHEGSHLSIEQATSISPDRYTELWDEMDVSASFSAQLYPENDIIEHKLVQLVTHLQGEHFYIVAAGEADHVLTIYGFASGFKKTEDGAGGHEDSNMDDSMRLGITAVSFLMELKIHMDSSAHPQGLWSFECNCKCTSPPSSAVFIKMMLLGDCLQLVKN